jgi:hypothetical protein
MSEDIKKVYSGVRVEAMFLKEMLEESGIGVIMKDRLASSAKAGWADGPAADTVILFVETFNEATAKELIETYFRERESSGGYLKDEENQD